MRTCASLLPAGIVKFHESSLSELESLSGGGGGGSDPEDTQSIRSLRSMGNVSLSGSVLDGVIGHVRESLGVELHQLHSASSRSVPCCLMPVLVNLQVVYM